MDGEPTSRLPDRISSHSLFKRVFKNAQISVFHRGGGIFETNSGKLQHTFAYDKNSGGVIIREIDQVGCSRRLLDSKSFVNDLPHQLVTDYNFWMSLGDVSQGGLDIKLWPLNSDIEEPEATYRILLDSKLNGRVTDCKSGRTMLNFNGSILSRICESFLWRIDQKQFVFPWLPLHVSDDPALSDQWSLCLELHRLHLHVEIWKSEETRIILREFDNMIVSPTQFLDTFVGLKHMLVLERPNKLRTVIVPHLNLKTERISAKALHHQLVPVSFELNKVIPFFAFDEDRFLRQMRPNGTETHISWLMCAYLHAATSGAMKDPLTGLTGLEMAVTQLRRCYLNKPFDDLSLEIFAMIEKLSVKRSFVHDTEIVVWDETRSAYSSSEVYAILVNCILSRSRDLSELHGASNRQINLSKFAAAKKGYSQYERIYSEEARLNIKEKDLISYSVDPYKAGKVVFSSNVKRDTNPVYQVMHAFRCQKELKLMDAKRSKKPLNFPSNSPPSNENPVERHVGNWSSGNFGSIPNWLWLYLEALESRSRPNEIERAERLAIYLSFVVYKWLISGCADVDLLIQVTVSEYPPAAHLQNHINTRISSHMDQLNGQTPVILQQVSQNYLTLQ